MDYRGMMKMNAGSYDEGLRAFMIGVFNKLFISLGITTVVAWYICSNPKIVMSIIRGPFWLLAIAQIGIAFALPMRLQRMQLSTANNLLWAFSALTGVTIAPVLFVYTGESIASAFFSSAAFFGAMSLVGYTTKRDLTSFGTFLLIGLISISVTSLINMWFLKSSSLSLGISAISILIFAGYTAYDVQNLKKVYSRCPDDELLSKVAVFGALQLFLDFINIFLNILRLLGDRKN